ncbi:MAG: hypothetical protein Q4P05_04130 [Actinomycetaceae bacterium]|nr:hypothetical protein [Actinomycetaceae bacterium]
MSSNLQSPNITALPTPPSGTEVASYRTYAEAQAAVDHLSDRQLEVRVLTIVGTDLRLVERITGRLTLGKVILSGALSGMWFGLFITILMALWLSESSLVIIPIGVSMGALFGIIFNVVPYVLRRGERDFTSATQVVASRYAVLANENIAQFRQILANSPGNLTRPAERRSPMHTSGPTAFGSRPDEQPKYGVRLSEKERREDSEVQATAGPDLKQTCDKPDTDQNNSGT